MSTLSAPSARHFQLDPSYVLRLQQLAEAQRQAERYRQQALVESQRSYEAVQREREHARARKTLSSAMAASQQRQEGLERENAHLRRLTLSGGSRT